MKNLNLKIAVASLLTSGLLLSNAAFALEGISSNVANGTDEYNINENDEVTLSFNHPQSLSVSSPNNVANRASSGIINRTWHVVSNNAVKVYFTGKSPDAAGTVVGTPTFYKAELGADGAQIGTQYDHLITTFGATVNNMGANQGTMTGTNNFGSGAVAKTVAVGTGGKTARINTINTAGTNDDATITGTPATLISNGGQGFGTIMPDDNGNFSLTLSARGVGDVATTQSGDYQITVVASFIAAELGNATITPNAIETTDTSGLLTATQDYSSIASTAKDGDGNYTGATNADNTQWTAEKSNDLSYNLQSVVGADGTTRQDISAQKASDVATDTKASQADYYDEQAL